MKFNIIIFSFFLLSILFLYFFIQNTLNPHNIDNTRSLEEETESEIVHIIKFNFEITLNFINK